MQLNLMKEGDQLNSPSFCSDEEISLDESQQPRVQVVHKNTQQVYYIYIYIDEAHGASVNHIYIQTYIFNIQCESQAVHEPNPPLWTDSTRRVRHKANIVTILAHSTIYTYQIGWIVELNI